MESPTIKYILCVGANLELVGFQLFGFLVVSCLAFNYSLMYTLLFYSLFMFCSLVKNLSSWVGLVFFLVYIGALLVLFFFMFSLSKNYLSGSPDWSFMLGLGAMILLFLSQASYYLIPSSKIFKEMGEQSVKTYDFNSLYMLILFVCLVVWKLNQMNFLNNTSLRPFS